jgi:energy-converting hydrogenase Eha subunit E
MLTFVIRATAMLLGIGALLVVLGSFDATLGWDIFGPALESALFGLFFSSIGLATIGVALCFVFGIHELVALMRSAQLGEAPPSVRPGAYYWSRAGVVVAGVALLVVALEMADGRIQAHRRGVFRAIAREQLSQLAPKLGAALPAAPPASSAELDALMRTLDNLDSVDQATLFLKDANDPNALWRYARYRGQGGDAFERIFAAKQIEKSAIAALNGDSDALDETNSSPAFTWAASIGRAAHCAQASLPAPALSPTPHARSASSTIALGSPTHVTHNWCTARVAPTWSRRRLLASGGKWAASQPASTT